ETVKLDGELPSLSTSHLQSMTDHIGLVQHATYTLPNLDHGYCVDDNARALLLTAYLENPQLTGHSLVGTVERLQDLYLEFVQKSFNPAKGRFRNFMSRHGKWLEDQGSDDSHARTLWALGVMTRRSQARNRRDEAAELFQRAAPAVLAMNS